MTRFMAFVTLTVCLLVAEGAAMREQPVFRATGDAVRVFVTVTDGAGRLVTTLTQDVFEVRDEGKPQARWASASGSSARARSSTAPA